jgi:N6-L-threonylcarbamoyladenine synthase
MITLGIETSCDETGVGIVKNGKEILANVVYSQIEKHKIYGGVVPEIASREHLEKLIPTIEQALHQANISLNDISAIGVVNHPGLIGSLMVGVQTAKVISHFLKIPIFAIDHLKAHIYSVIMSNNNITYPAIGMVLSGGHTTMFIVKSPIHYKRIGDTRDDAIGECMDKVSKILGLGYPGGPIIEKLSQKATQKKIILPYIMTKKQKKDDFSFSFSGIKTAVIRLLQQYPDTPKEEIAYSLQEVLFEVVQRKVENAIKKFKAKSILIGGGVSINNRLREIFSKYNAFFPEKSLCGDNGAMVAGITYQYLKQRKPDNPLYIDVSSN